MRHEILNDNFSIALMLFSSAHYAQRLSFPGARNFSIVIPALANQTQNDTQQRGHGAGGGGHGGGDGRHGGDGEGSSAPPGVAVSGHQSDGDTLLNRCMSKWPCKIRVRVST